MPYEENLDKTIWEKVIPNGEGKQIIVGVYSYNEGVKKLGIKRKETIKRDDRDFSFRKLGRLTLEEAKLVNEAMSEGLKHME